MDLSTSADPALDPCAFSIIVALVASELSDSTLAANQCFLVLHSFLYSRVPIDTIFVGHETAIFQDCSCNCTFALGDMAHVSYMVETYL